MAFTKTWTKALSLHQITSDCWVVEGSPAVRQLTLELARSKQSFYPTIRNGATRAKLCLEEVLKVFVQTDFTAAVEKSLVCAKALQAGCGCSVSTWNAWNAPDKGNNLI